MNFLTNLFTMKELIIMGCVLGGLILLVIIFSVLTILDRKKQEDLEFLEFDKDDDAKEKVVQKIEEPKEEVIQKVDEMKEAVLINLNKEEKVETVLENKTEVKKVEEPLIMDIEDEEEVMEIEEINEVEKAKEELLKVEAELQNPKSLEDTITSLEAMEEESAIISYQELLETTKEMNIIETDSGDEFISISELFQKYNEPKVIAEMTDVSINDAYRGEFTSSPYLSPVEGVETVQNLNEIQLENTANLEKLDKEIRKTNEFLNILNELKKNLE